MGGTALLCPVETISIAAATDPKNGSKNIINGYKQSISNGSINGIYTPSRVISATGRSGAGIVSFTMGGDLINSYFRDDDGKIKGNDLYKASVLTGAVTAVGCTPLELAHFWGKNLQNEYSLKTLSTNVARAMRGAGTGIGMAMVPRMAITIPLAAARNMGRLASPLEHNVHHHDEVKPEPKEPELSWQQKMMDSKNGEVLSPVNMLKRFKGTNLEGTQSPAPINSPNEPEANWLDRVKKLVEPRER